ncbi:MAG: carbohydrate ABC transporter permease [Clostridiales bacterium]|jgi:raffinose/stachyose/melibiose transport system permease protein/N-acetylglucosamine transport system permease protein|nr:carbohydrate ABC transporter permease [Clostridiales bacterium]
MRQAYTYRPNGKNRIRETGEASKRIVLSLNTALCAVYCLSLMLPLIWMLYSAFKTNLEYQQDIMAFPKSLLYFENFSVVFEKLRIIRVTTVGGVPARVTYGLGNMLVTSFYFALAVSVINVFFNTVFGYILSKYKFRGRGFLYGLGIFIMVVPIIGTEAAYFRLIQQLGVYDNMVLTVLSAPSVAFSGTYFLLMYAAFKGLAWEYAEAAFIDGAGHYKVFLRIMLPMAMPSMICLVTLNFIGMWNDYSAFLFYLPSYANLSYGLYIFEQNAAQYGVNPPVIYAGFVIAAVPVVGIYSVAQKFILQKFTVGGLKG